MDEMAYRLQSSAPELMNLASEPKEVLDMYGVKDPQEVSYARNCLLARRLIERGVRFVQLFHEAWDQHANLTADVKKDALDTDQASAALVRDIYRGVGLAGVPRGTVKRLRLYTLHFAYRGRGGLLGTVGLDGPWDVRRVLGTVPVTPDGSACFRIPANTPVSLQPLDAEGTALQQMRSWFVGMPGERISCLSCHEPQDSVPAAADSPALEAALSAIHSPSEITPWYGAPRNFSFQREVQPVIDRLCTGCHDGSRHETAMSLPDLRGDVRTADYQTQIDSSSGIGERYFSEAYFQLSRFVRQAGIESDMHVLSPGEFHADTTDLVRQLRQGHYGVQLNDEDWDRLITWIDLNAPFHGTWTETGMDPGAQRQQWRALRMRYARVDEDPESLADATRPPPARPRSASRRCPRTQFPIARRPRRRSGLSTRWRPLGGKRRPPHSWFPPASRT